MIEKYFNIGDIVIDNASEEWEVLGYAEVFDGTLSMKETEMVSCKHLHSGKRKRINQNELYFIKSNNKPFIIE